MKNKTNITDNISTELEFGKDLIKKNIIIIYDQIEHSVVVGVDFEVVSLIPVIVE
jgi:hypothetical protein